MKAYWLIVVVICCTLSCKKTQVNVSPGLFGKWEVRHTMGSIVGYDSTFKAGNGRVLQFSQDSTYRSYNKQKLLQTGKFHIRPTDYPTANSLAILFDNSEYAQVFILKGDSLQIGMDVNDGVETDFVKISD